MGASMGGTVENGSTVGKSHSAIPLQACNRRLLREQCTIEYSLSCISPQIGHSSSDCKFVAVLGRWGKFTVAAHAGAGAGKCGKQIRTGEKMFLSASPQTPQSYFTAKDSSHGNYLALADQIFSGVKPVTFGSYFHPHLGIEGSTPLRGEAAFYSYTQYGNPETASGETIHHDGRHTDVSMCMMLPGLVMASHFQTSTVLFVLAQQCQFVPAETEFDHAYGACLLLLHPR